MGRFKIDWEQRKVLVGVWSSCPRCGCEDENEEELDFTEILDLAKELERGQARSYTDIPIPPPIAIA